MPLLGAEGYLLSDFSPYNSVEKQVMSSVKERTELNKGNVIEIRCKKCNKLMMEYFVCGDDSAVALQNVGIKCDRCKRVMILKKYSEGMMKEHSENGTFRIRCV